MQITFSIEVLLKWRYVVRSCGTRRQNFYLIKQGHIVAVVVARYPLSSARPSLPQFHISISDSVSSSSVLWEFGPVLR